VVLTMPGYCPASICVFSPSPLGPPAAAVIGSSGSCQDLP
jgi:hypothetical protein